MALIDTTFAQKITGIDDQEVLQFMIDAIIAKIEKIIGYSLSQQEKTEVITGLNTSYVWLKRKPVSNVASVVLFDETLATDEYKLKNAENTPHLILEDSILCSEDEIEVTYTAGFADGQLDPDIRLLIFNVINDFKSNLENGDLKSYKFEGMSYKFTSYLAKQNNFYSQVLDVFGVNI